MIWEFKEDRPIYAQLIEQIEQRIISGIYPVGSKLPSVRDMASQAAVNPNTMQRALTELERNGLVYSQRTSGRFITEDESMITQAKKSIAMQVVNEFFARMSDLGFSKEETIKLLEKPKGDLQ